MADIIGYAVVQGNGALLHEFAVDHVDHQAGSGLYDVFFTSGAAGAAAQIVSSADQDKLVVARGGVVAANVVQVSSTDIAGNPEEATFQLLIAS